MTEEAHALATSDLTIYFACLCLFAALMGVAWWVERYCKKDKPNDE